LSRIYSRMGEIQSAQESLDQAHLKGEITQSHFYDQVFTLWAQADLYVAEEKWKEAWGTYEQLVNLTGGKKFHWHSRQASIDWAEALLKRGETKDVNMGRQMLQESLQDFQNMGAAGFVERIESRINQLDQDGS